MRLLPRLEGCGWVLLGGQTAGDFPAETIAVLADAGLTVCLDGQGLARGSRVGPLKLGPVPSAALAGVHTLKLNDEEAAAAGHIAVPELLVTRADRGCEVTAGGERTVVPGTGGRFADPTGAGDSLSALYCLARTRGQPPPEAVRWAQAEVERIYRSS
jgi:sugar/nucleoside kinase (ribokinase family)